MPLLRKCNSLTLLLIIVSTLILGYGYLTLQQSYLHVQQKDHELVKRRDHENILKEQLKVVYHHTSKVEEELSKERDRHKETLLDLLDKKKQFYSNLTKIKHEAWTRFNALDSDYKMLKAEHEEMKTNYMGLQAQYRRLSSDHHRLSNEARQSYEELKSSKEAESLSLQDRIQDMYKKYTYFRRLSDQHEEYYLKVQKYYNSCQKLTQLYKNSSMNYYEQLKAKQPTHGRGNLNIRNQSSLDNEFEQLQKDVKNITLQKSHSQTWLKNLTGVQDADLLKEEKDSTNYPTTFTSTSSSTKIHQKNFILEQKKRFMKNKEKQSGRNYGNDRYAGLMREGNSKIGDNNDDKNNKIDGSKDNDDDGTDNMNPQSEGMTTTTTTATTSTTAVTTTTTTLDGGNPKFPVLDNSNHQIEQKNRANPIARILPPRGQLPATEKAPERQDEIENDQNVNGHPQNNLPLAKPNDEKKIIDSNDRKHRSRRDTVFNNGNDRINQIEAGYTKGNAFDKHRAERMDVKKVTLEEDENGDQNLDSNEMIKDPEFEVNYEKQAMEEDLKENDVGLNNLNRK